uniref:Uncharacterized protein n=1 Tax=Apteryx owenii TaxID=8824 RepID=A0A8B9P0W4_APTOW
MSGLKPRVLGAVQTCEKKTQSIPEILGITLASCDILKPCFRIKPMSRINDASGTKKHLKLIICLMAFLEKDGFKYIFKGIL